jgi:hypothetical protein
MDPENTIFFLEMWLLPWNPQSVIPIGNKTTMSNEVTTNASGDNTVNKSKNALRIIEYIKGSEKASFFQKSDTWERALKDQSLFYVWKEVEAMIEEESLPVDEEEVASRIDSFYDDSLLPMPQNGGLTDLTISTSLTSDLQNFINISSSSKRIEIDCDDTQPVEVGLSDDNSNLSSTIRQ